MSMILVCRMNWTPGTALHVKTDALLKESPHLAPAGSGRASPKLSDAELVTLAVMQALIVSPRSRGCCTSPAPIWASVYLPAASAQIQQAAADSCGAVHCGDQGAGRGPSLWSGDVWVADATSRMRRSRGYLGRGDVQAGPPVRSARASGVWSGSSSWRSTSSTPAGRPALAHNAYRAAAIAAVAAMDNSG